MLCGKFKNEYFSLLMLAALNGHDEVVRIMLTHTLANKKQIEQEGCAFDINNYLTRNVTALRCALDRGHFHVARTLIDFGGADVNHGLRGPLLIDATIRRRFDIVHYLVENGYADVNRAVTNDMYQILEQSTMSDRDRHLIIQWIKDLCREKRRTENGRTLLHLSVDVETYGDINYRPADIMHTLIFPNLATTRLLVCFGKRWIDLDAVDLVNNDTALHKILQSWAPGNNKDTKAIVELLINAGAHIDCANARGHRPVDVATVDEIRALLQSKQRLPRLKCLCARVITDQQIVYDNLWPTPTTKNTFLRLHGGLKRKRSMSDYSITSFDVYDDIF
ncbi:unnamed protein product [Rotaria sp. Silwood2]|nr:unnamed protein product [Rotaria sp. Silwood2]